jgi:hypothetical protein
MMVMTVMMMDGGERRRGEDEQKQDGCENLFHASNVARTRSKG